MNRYQRVKQGLEPVPGMEAFMAEREEIEEARTKKVKRSEIIEQGRRLDRTPETYRRHRFLADLSGMAGHGGYLPDFFCDTKIAEEFVEAGVAERLTIKGEDNVRRSAYRQISVPF